MYHLSLFQCSMAGWVKSRLTKSSFSGINWSEKNRSAYHERNGHKAHLSIWWQVQYQPNHPTFLDVDEQREKLSSLTLIWKSRNNEYANIEYENSTWFEWLIWMTMQILIDLCLHKQSVWLLFSAISLSSRQLIKNSAARKLTQAMKYDHISQILASPHRRPATFRIEFKLLLITKPWEALLRGIE